jgi:hypothetical protein
MISTEGLKDDRSGCKYCLITVEKMLVALGVMVSFTVPWTFGEAYWFEKLVLTRNEEGVDSNCFRTDSTVKDEQRNERASVITNETTACVLSAVEENIDLLKHVLELKDAGVDGGRHFTATAGTSHSI